MTSFRFVESIRKLRRRVEQHMDGGKVLIVTSLLENEGKSTVAVNLALAMEQKGKRVLLIDCDLRKPACGMVLGQSKFTYGLNDILGARRICPSASCAIRTAICTCCLPNAASRTPATC